MKGVMRFVAGAGLLVIMACSCQSFTAQTNSSPARSPAASATAAPEIAKVPPAGSQRMDGECGTTDVYKGGTLPDWANVNAPKGLPYVVTTPGLAVGYIFSYPLRSGLDANTKVLWYVATPRGGQPLTAEGHPVGAAAPIARFTKAADSFPGEIYPSGPTVPSAGCWHFTLTWGGGDEHAEVDLLFQ